MHCHECYFSMIRTFIVPCSVHHVHCPSFSVFKGGVRFNDEFNFQRYGHFVFSTYMVHVLVYLGKLCFSMMKSIFLLRLIVVATVHSNA